jgi:cytochrome c biogenesis protein
MTEEGILALYGETSLKARVIILLGLTDLYHSLWFQALIGILAVNISLCTAERFPKTLKLWSHEDKDLHPERLRKFSNFSEFTSQKNLDEVTSQLKNFFNINRWKTLKEINREQRWAGVFTKGQVFLFSVYGVHASVLLILIGAFAGSVLGFKGTMAILEGDSTSVVNLLRKDKIMILPFEIRCDRFYIQFYPDGTPSEYVSEVTILEDGKEVRKAAIKVNDPLTYRDVSFYQATYGTIIKRAIVNFTDERTNEEIKLELTTESEEVIPGKNAVVQFMDYREEFGGFGPAIAIGMLEEGKEPQASWILVKHPNFHGNRIGDYRVAVLDVEPTYYTGLQVKRDPGVWLVLIGFLGLVVFILATFYGRATKVWCVVEETGNSTKIHVAMKSNKSGLTDENFSNFCIGIEKIL